MGDYNDPEGEGLEERTRQHNSNLQLLIEAIGGVLAASADLLARLQQILTGAQLADGAGGKPAPPDDAGD